MSDQDIKTVSSATGAFPAIRPTARSARSGSAAADHGKMLPARKNQDLDRLAERLNKAAQSIGRDLRFRVDLEKGRSVIQVLDRETGEIIRQIPPEGARTYVSELGDVALRLYDAQV